MDGRADEGDEQAAAAGAPKTASRRLVDDIDRVVLGDAEVSPLNQANAYATYANGGVHVDTHVIKEIDDRTGKIIYKAEPDEKRAVSKDVAADVTYALSDVVEEGTGRPCRRPQPAGGRQDRHPGRRATRSCSAWFVGYTKQIATAVMYVAGDAGNVTSTPTSGPATPPSSAAPIRRRPGATTWRWPPRARTWRSSRPRLRQHATSRTCRANQLKPPSRPKLRNRPRGRSRPSERAAVQRHPVGVVRADRRIHQLGTAERTGDVGTGHQRSGDAVEPADQRADPDRTSQPTRTATSQPTREPSSAPTRTATSRPSSGQSDAGRSNAGRVQRRPVPTPTSPTPDLTAAADEFARRRADRL